MKVQRISARLLKDLLRVPPSRNGSVEYRPCRVTLMDGRVLDHVVLAEAEPYFVYWGVWPDEDPGKKWIPIEEVEALEESPVRLPPRLADKMYEAGESGMGYCIFTLTLSDRRTFACLTGNLVDFPFLPEGVGSGMIVDLLPHAGREEGPRRGPDYFWCLYSSSG